MSTTFNNGLYTPDTPAAATSLAPIPSSAPLPPSSSVIQPTVLPSTSIAEIIPTSSSVAPVAVPSTTSLASTTPPASSTLGSMASVPTNPFVPTRTIAGTVFTYASPSSTPSSPLSSTIASSTATALPSTDKSGIDIKTLTPVFVVIPLILIALVLGFTYNKCWGGAGFKRSNRKSKGDSWGESGLDGNGYRGAFNEEKGLVKGRWLGEEKEFMRNREEGAEERNALAGAFPPIRKVTALSRFKGFFSRGDREDDKEFMAVPYTPLETPFMNPSDSTGDILRKAYLHPERDDEEDYPQSGGGGASGSGYGREEERGWAWGTNQQRQSQFGEDNRYPTAPMVGGRNIGDSPQKSGLRGPRSQGLAVDGWKKYRPKSTASISSLRSSTLGSINSLINSLGAGAGGLRKKRAPGGIDENGKFTALLNDHDVDDDSSYSPARKTTLTRAKSKLLPAVDPGMSPSIYSPATTFTNEHDHSPSLTNDNGSITGTSIATEDYDSLASRRQRDYELNQYLGQSRVGNNDLAGRFLNGDLTPEEEEISRFDSRKEVHRDEKIEEEEEVVESHGFRMEEEEVLPRPGRTYVSPKKGSTVRAGGRQTPYTPTKPALLFCYDSPPSQSRIKNRPLASPLKVSSRPSPSTHQRTQSTTSSMRSPGGALPPHQVEQIRNSESTLGLNGGLRGLIFGSSADLVDYVDEEKVLGASDSTSTLIPTPQKKLEEIPPVVESLGRKPSKALPPSPTPSSPPPSLPSFARPISQPRSISSSTQATIPSARTPTKSNPTTPTRQSAASRVRQAINELETKSFNEAPLSPSTNRSVKKATPSHGFIGARPMYGSNQSSYQTTVSDDEEAEDEESIRPVAPLRYTRPISTPPPSRTDRIPASASPYRSPVPNPMMMGGRSKSSNTLYQQNQAAAAAAAVTTSGGRMGGARAMSTFAQARTVSVETGKLASPVRVKVPGSSAGGFPTHKRTMSAGLD